MKTTFFITVSLLFSFFNASTQTYSKISLPSYSISGAHLQTLLTSASRADSLEADVSITVSNDTGIATLTFYQWKSGSKTAIASGNFSQHLNYSWNISSNDFNSGSPLRCKNGLNGVTFTPDNTKTYYMVPDLITPPGSAYTYPYYHIKTSDDYFVASVTAKQFNPIPPGGSN